MSLSATDFRVAKPPLQVRRSQLIARSTQGNPLHYQVLRPDADSDLPVLAGRYEITSLRSGLQVKCADVRDLHDMNTEADLAPSLHIVVLLAGRAEACFGERRLVLGEHAQREDAASILSLARMERFVRQSRRGAYERKVGISLLPEWLEACASESNALRDFRRQHLALAQWRPSARATALAEQMLFAPDIAPGLRALYLEARALELVAEAFAQIEQTHGVIAVSGCDTRTQSRLLALREWLDSGAADELSLQEIARHAGFGARSLQMQFRATFGITLFDYLRGRRLDAARMALEQQGLPIAQAAWQAGYGSAANFATAFRRRFGICPRQIRKR